MTEAQITATSSKIGEYDWLQDQVFRSAGLARGESELHGSPWRPGRNGSEDWVFSQARWGLGAATHASATVLKKKRLLSKSGVCLEENLKGTAFCVGSVVVNDVGQGIPC